MPRTVVLRCLSNNSRLDSRRRYMHLKQGNRRQQTSPRVRNLLANVYDAKSNSVSPPDEYAGNR